MKLSCALLFTLTLSSFGCTTVRGNAELAWQTLNVVDAGQTQHIASAPACYQEADPLSVLLMGKHPSNGEAAGVFVLYAAGHLVVSKALEKKAESGSRSWKAAEIAWHVLSLVTKTAYVAHNHKLGLRPFGKGCHHVL